jgi:NAD(P)-dependent dehydrogenase (short-subunit alcohol dehydrogenase family)
VSGLPDLSGKIAVVTGGASGIGKGIAATLVAESARVIIADIQRDALDATAASGRRPRSPTSHWTTGSGSSA